MWDGYAWTTFNDSQPLSYPLPILVDAGQRFDTQTTWEADETMYLEDQAAINNATYCGALNCVMGLNRWQQDDNYLTYPYALMWRSSNPNTGSGFTSYPSPNLLTSTVWGSMNSQPSSQAADFSLSMKGSSNHEVGSGQHHENDTCSFVLAKGGEQFLIDPGYEIPAAANHNTLTVDGNTVGGGPTNTSSFDTTNEVVTANWQVVPMVCTNAYTAGVTAMRRTWAMYINGTKRFAFLLDDINPSGSGSIIEYLQTLPSPSSVSSAGLTLTGRAVHGRCDVQQPDEHGSERRRESELLRCPVMDLLHDAIDPHQLLDRHEQLHGQHGESHVHFFLSRRNIDGISGERDGHH